VSRLETKIPPPIVALLFALAMWLLAKALPRVAVAAPLRIGLACAVAGIGAVFALSGFVAFGRAKTTVDPIRPSKASTLVTSGVYRITRNPMYVGLFFLLTGWAIALASPVLLAAPLVFALYITRFQIQPEERALTALFGSAYTDYRTKVRRWL
jgi:protein-S-isoprenylcysteine O-methyltransferase Ste14